MKFSSRLHEAARLLSAQGKKSGSHHEVSDKWMNLPKAAINSRLVRCSAMFYSCRSTLYRQNIDITRNDAASTAEDRITELLFHPNTPTDCQVSVRFLLETTASAA
jgi:hypothetical protein